MDIPKIVNDQRKFFLTGKTLPRVFRLEMLSRLQVALAEYEEELCDAMLADMNKSPQEVYMTEIGIVLEEIRYHRKHLEKWMKAKTVPTPVSQFPARSFVLPQPHGVALVMSPWNYPIQLCLNPLVGAISAGCTVVVKPSNYAPETSHVLAQMLREIYPEKYVAVVEGGREENTKLLQQKYDYIFFTGSPGVGRIVMESAAKYLTPVTLELGGKSPVIVDETADLKLAARRIAFGKVLNAGQTCVAPDYLLIQESVKETFIKQYQIALNTFFPDGDMSGMNVIINEKHYQRLVGLLEGEHAVIGGGRDEKRRFIEPTLLDDVSWQAPVMQEEIFGPILPVLTYKDMAEAIRSIQSKPKPLALYLFTESKEIEKQVFSGTSFGGGCVNDTIVHLANSHMGFGGVGESGMGSYHGRKSFDTFTHYRSVLKKSNHLDLPMRYRPYSQWKDKLVRLFLQ